MTMIEEADWGRLHHAYGTAEDLPEMLRDLRDPDPQVRGRALGELHSTVLHQGSRFEASQAVVPFLVRLVDDPETPDRDGVLRLLVGIAVGDRGDDALPFAPPVVSVPDGPETADVVRRFHDEEFDFTDAEHELLDLVVEKWQVDCYHRAAEHRDLVVSWIGDADDTVAALAAAFAAWFPADDATVAAWLGVPAGREQPRASANLALAHSGLDDPRIDRLLDELTGAGSPIVAVTAAVGTAYRKGKDLSPAALSVLIEAAEREPFGEVTGWSRALRGFVMLALHRVGL